MKKFTKILNKTIKEKKLLKSEVASSFGWTPMYFGRYCNGNLLPTSSNIDKFANFLEISTDDILRLVEEEDD